ncbi:MAG: short-chain dehydrogenase/reductase [Acidimicrobiales bacterium]|nr:short-chain dehydrogenase/reductase [Acidimicrobiales bacterium]
MLGAMSTPSHETAPLPRSIAAAFDLSGRVAIVTGAAGGIGLASAATLARAGAHVVLTDVQATQVEAQAAALTGEGLSCEGRALDVSRQADVNALVDDIVARHGRLDVMMNNAGVIDDTSPLTVTEADLDRVHAVNFKGVVFGAQAAARVMIAAGGGSIINVTSGAVDIALAQYTGYSTAKAAAHQFSRGLAIEIAKKSVRVNTLAPGWTDTPMNERHVRNEDGSIDPSRKADYVQQRANWAPLQMTGDPLDQAYAVLYLASDASRYVTGQVIRVNGGVTMPW